MSGEGLNVHLNTVFPVSGCTETKFRTGGNGGSVMQSVCEYDLTDNKITIRI